MNTIILTLQTTSKTADPVKKQNIIHKKLKITRSPIQIKKKKIPLLSRKGTNALFWSIEKLIAKKRAIKPGIIKKLLAGKMRII